jgi:hypothetical protein
MATAAACGKPASITIALPAVIGADVAVSVAVAVTAVVAATPSPDPTLVMLTGLCCMASVGMLSGICTCVAFTGDPLVTSVSIAATGGPGEADVAGAVNGDDSFGLLIAGSALPSTLLITLELLRVFVFPSTRCCCARSLRSSSVPVESGSGDNVWGICCCCGLESLLVVCAKVCGDSSREAARLLGLSAIGCARCEFAEGRSGVCDLE